MRKAQIRVVAALALIVSTIASANSHSSDWGEQFFNRLARHPEFKVQLHEEAVILNHGENFYAAFATVSSPDYPIYCAFAAAFKSDIGLTPGNYDFEFEYICDTVLNLKKYDGLFPLLLTCPKEEDVFCPMPAIGVGNLRILPGRELILGRLPHRLPVLIDGRVPDRVNPLKPVAGLNTP